MKGIIIPAIVENISTRKDKSIKLVFGTQELSPENAAQLLSLMNQICAVYISSKEPIQEEIDNVDKIDPEFSGKTKSQRLRNVLYKLFDQKSEGYKTFDEYYSSKMEQIITHYKNKIQ